ncbi:MAG: glycosyltransferase family 2 protein [Bacteroidota bacterium]
MSNKKLVSVIMATYNRSNIIGYAIKTVINQVYTDWELLVIGDHCTDDTGKVVNEFGDSRVTFFNLPENIGEQSGPNNFGLDQAKGDYIAFLNHDDLWFPDHLSSLVACIEENNAGLVYAWWNPVSAGPHHFKPMMIDPDHNYTLQTFVPASAWLFDKEIINKVGKWRSFKEIYDIPSQDWLKRVHLSKVPIKSTGHLTMLAIQSGPRKNVYVNRDYVENAHWYERLENPDEVRVEILSRNLIYSARKDRALLGHLKTFVWNLFKALLIQFNIRPTAAKYFFRFRGKGGFLNNLRNKRGLKRI